MKLLFGNLNRSETNFNRDILNPKPLDQLHLFKDLQFGKLRINKIREKMALAVGDPLFFRVHRSHSLWDTLPLWVLFLNATPVTLHPEFSFSSFGKPHFRHRNCIFISLSPWIHYNTELTGSYFHVALLFARHGKTSQLSDWLFCSLFFSFLFFSGVLAFQQVS